MPSSDDKVVYDRPSPAPAPSSYPQGPRPSVSGVLDPLVWKKNRHSGGGPPLLWREAAPTAGAASCRGGAPRGTDRLPPRTHMHKQRSTPSAQGATHQGGHSRRDTAVHCDGRPAPAGPAIQKKTIIKGGFSAKPWGTRSGEGRSKLPCRRCPSTSRGAFWGWPGSPTGFLHGTKWHGQQLALELRSYEEMAHVP